MLEAVEEQLDDMSTLEEVEYLIETLEQEEEREERQDQFEETTPAGYAEDPNEEDELIGILDEINEEVDAPIEGWQDEDLRDEQLKELIKFEEELEAGEDIDEIELEALKADVINEMVKKGMISFAAH